MLRYIVKRILIFIPTLFAISILAFVISINSPGDPVESLFSGVKETGDGTGAASQSNEMEKNLFRKKLGLDLPVFYFTLGSFAEPDTLYKVYQSDRNTSLTRLIDTYGNWPEISSWYLSLEKLRSSIYKIHPDSVANSSLGKEKADQLLDETKQEISSLLITYDDVIIENKLKKIELAIQSNNHLGVHNFLSEIEMSFNFSESAFKSMKVNSTTWKNWIPSFHFYGYNQYHRWLFGDGNWLTGSGWKNTEGVIRGDFGTSYSTKMAVTKTIARAVPWSLFFTVISVLLAYLISIPIGVQAAAKRGSFFDRSSSIFLFMLYSIPVFFMGTLLLLAFANPAAFNIFPVNGVKPATGYPDGISLWEKFKITLPYLILPLVCYTYSSLAFLSRTMRVAMLEVIGQDYIRTAKAKGLTYYLVIYKHGLRNALLPIITVFANIFPAAVGGSILIEVLFGIPGMGQEVYQAVLTKDYPMIVCVFSLSGFMTLVGYLFADILYAVVDPRISYTK